MKSILSICILAASLFFSSFADAQDYRWGVNANPYSPYHGAHHGSHHRPRPPVHRPHYRGDRYRSSDLAIAFILGGVVGSTLPRVVYSPPPRTYYYSRPQTCWIQEVSRYDRYGRPYLTRERVCR